MFNADAGEIMNVERIEPKGSVLVVYGQIMGTMPLTAEIRPEEARAALKLLDLKTVLFLLTLPFRKSVGADDAA